MAEDSDLIQFENLSPDAPRGDQRAVIKQVVAEIDARVLHAREVASDNYSAGLEMKRNIIAEDMAKSQEIARQFKDQVKAYLGVSVEDSVATDAEKMLVFDPEKGERMQQRFKNKSGEMRARGKMADTVQKIDATIASTIETLMTTAPFMGQKTIEIKRESGGYEDMMTRRGVIEGEIVPDVAQVPEEIFE